MQEVGAPGMVVGVSIDGSTVWSKGFGLADVENHIPCRANTVMRVASISKSFTALAMARLWEEGKIDLDKPIQEYVSEFPEKHFDGSKVTITLRQLLSHTSGIRHYSKSVDPDAKDKEFELKEYYLTKPFKNISEALSLFQADPLLKNPGSEFLYTTHGWTLISAVLEKASGQDFLMLMGDLFRRMGMNNTVPDYHDKIVYNRARYYSRNKKGRLLNAPYVDNSYKWAGGGFLSTVEDLLKFGNVMLYCYQGRDTNNHEDPPPLVRSDTVKKMWSCVSKRQRKSAAQLENEAYGLGWFVFPEQDIRGCCPTPRFEVSHSGGAIGASSVLFLVPGKEQPVDEDSQSLRHTTGGRGVVVAIVCNLQSIGLTNLARAIAQEFIYEFS